MLNILKEAKIPKVQFTTITPKRKVTFTQQDVQLRWGMTEASNELSDEDQDCHDKLFSCPEKGCIKSLHDKIRLKLIKDWYSTAQDVKSWHGVLGVKYKHILQMLQTRGQAMNDPKIMLNQPFDSSFTADFKVRTFQNSFLSAYFNLMWV